MPGVTVKIIPPKGTEPYVREAICKATHGVYVAAVTGAPRRSGILAGSHIETMSAIGGQWVGRVTARAPYAMFVHDGTGIYGPRGQRIFPKRAKFLVFPSEGARGQWFGGFVFARSVRGQPSQPWLIKALAVVGGGHGVRGYRRSTGYVRPYVRSMGTR